MKHFLLFFIMALVSAASPAFGAFTYEIVRTGYDADHHPADNDSRDSLYKIRITEGTGEIYLSDWIDNVGSAHQEDALTVKGITQYGYYYVSSNDASKIGKYEVKNLWIDAIPEPIETVKSPWNDNMITRFKYSLGTFSAGDEVEIYMKDSRGGEVWSNTTMYRGAYNSGTNVDELVKYQMGYYNTYDNAIVDAAKKAMPLAALDTGNGRVFFGISGSEKFGSPLPGGLSIALVAGLFALGFWFIRRRKALAA